MYEFFFSGKHVYSYFAQVPVVKLFIKTVVIKVEKVKTEGELHVILFTHWGDSEANHAEQTILSEHDVNY